MVVRYSMDRKPQECRSTALKTLFKFLHESIRDPVFPVGQDVGQMFLYGVGKVLHLSEQRSIHGRQIALGEGLKFSSLILIPVLRFFAERPSRLLALKT
jgi:hypothetical protein